MRQATSSCFYVLLVSANWSYLIHANVRWRLGVLEWLITSPAFHHWHHTRDGEINHNYSTMLPWMDRIFGTYHLPRADWPEAYGIMATMPDSLSEQLIYPLFPQVALNATAGYPLLANLRSAVLEKQFFFRRDPEGAASGVQLLLLTR